MFLFKKNIILSVLLSATIVGGGFYLYNQKKLKNLHPINDENLNENKLVTQESEDDEVVENNEENNDGELMTIPEEREDNNKENNSKENNGTK